MYNPTLDTMLFDELCDYLETQEIDIQSDTSKYEILQTFATYQEYYYDDVYLQISDLLEYALEQFSSLHNLCLQPKTPPCPKRAKVQEVLSRPQIVQRSEEWYADKTQALSASQFSTIFKGGRTRGQLVLEKAGKLPKQEYVQRHCCHSSIMTPFDWGIRFEPMVREIYMAMTNTKVADVGRLRHLTDKRLSASPDGIVCEDYNPDQPYLSRLVEYKAPVTRNIDNTVPSDYEYQMKLQMEVANVQECDYFEVRFQSTYNKKLEYVPIENPLYYGVIYLIEEKETNRWLRYDYSPLNVTEYNPVIAPNESIAEVIPWKMEKYFMKTMVRDPTWFASVMPTVEQFWADVEAAKNDNFVMPESKRTKKAPACKFVEDN